MDLAVPRRPGFRRADRPLGVAPASVTDYRELARRRLPRQLFDYIDGGAYDEATLRANVADLASILLRQVVLRDVGHRSTATTVLSERLAMPVILGPVGMAGMYARRGEVQAARAAAEAGVPFVESTVSVCAIEEVAGAVRPPWFQLYVMRERGVTEGLVTRAADAGCRVLVLTVDLAVVGARLRDTRNGLEGDGGTVGAARRLFDLASHVRWAVDVAAGGRPHTFGNLVSMVPGARSPAAFRSWVDAQFDPTVTWKDVAWIRRLWHGPLVVKGLLDPDDARRARDAGADGIVVSNHGGRQLDSTPSTARALPAVVEAVGSDVEVLVDGGVRTGLDVAKFLALGAKATFIGRAWAWALAAGGEPAVARVLERLRADLDIALALTGAGAVDQLGPANLAAPPPRPAEG